MSFVIGSENLFDEIIVPFILEFSPTSTSWWSVSFSGSWILRRVSFRTHCG